MFAIIIILDRLIGQFNSVFDIVVVVVVVVVFVVVLL